MIEFKELNPKLWKDIELLFGNNGACGGCWCMSWRIEKGEVWEDIKGETAKSRFKKLVISGKAQGVLAYFEGTPVGWCSMGPRKDFSRLDRAPSLKCNDAEDVWSIPCFFVHKDFRHQGVGTLLLNETLRLLKKKKVKIAEGYPVKPYDYGKSIPAAFAWTGTKSMFQQAGFIPVGKKDGGKQRVRLEVF